MKLQKDKWYVCIKSWSDDGWTKFRKGDLLRCEKDGELMDCYNVSHVFDDEWAGFLFREATDIERNIASATEVNLDEFMEDIMHFNPEDTLIGIYREGAYRMLKHIQANLTING